MLMSMVSIEPRSAHIALTAWVTPEQERINLEFESDAADSNLSISVSKVSVNKILKISPLI